MKMQSNCEHHNEIMSKKFYVKLNSMFENSMIKYLSNKINKHIYDIIMQFKMKHDYFEKFQKRRALWKN